MSAQKTKNIENSQRSNSLKNNKKERSQSTQKDEINNDNKRQLFEQMQNDLRMHPEGQAKAYEVLDNAKKLKKMLVNSIYQNRDPLYNLNQQNNSSINSYYNIDNSQTLDTSTSKLKVVKINQQFHNQSGNNLQNYKQRSTSVQREYSKKGQQNQSQNDQLNFIPNNSQIEMSNSNKLYNQANNSFSKQEQQQILNDKAILNTKKQVKFSEKKFQLSPTHQCFHKDGCPNNHQQISSNKNNILNISEQKETNENVEEMQETGKFINQFEFNNLNKELNDRELNQEMQGELNTHSSTKKNTYKRENKLQQENSSSKNLNQRNSPQPFQSTTKQNNSFDSTSNSGKKQGYSNQTEYDEERLDIAKKIQNQKDQIEEIAKKEGTTQNKEVDSFKDKISSSKKPPQNPQYQQIQQSQSTKNAFQKNSSHLGKPNLQDNKDTLQKQRSVSTQQQQNSSTSKINLNDRSQSKGKIIESYGKSQKTIEKDSENILNRSFDKNSKSSQQKIVDLQNIIERMKVENNTKLSNLEIKKLDEQLEKDKLYEKQMLDLKSQQKMIFILQQEKDLLQEQSDSLENKYKLTQSKIKHFEKIRIDLEDQIQKQILLTQEAKNQINDGKTQYSEINRKYNLLKKQCDELEKEKNKINVLKQKMENEAQQKITQYKCMNKQNFDLTIEFERKNKENLYQVNQLIEKVSDITKKYDESSKNEVILEKKLRSEQQQNEQLKVELKLIQASVSENSELKKKIKQQDNKLDELENIIDNLKRKIRNNLDIEMNSHLKPKQVVEKVIEKPVFIEKKVEVEKSSHNSKLAQEYKEQMIKCQQDFSEIKHRLATEQELYLQKSIECETWKNHSFQQEDKYHSEINSMKQNFDIERNMFDKELRDKENSLGELKIKINSLMQEVELLTHKNIDKNRQIANEIIQQNQVIQINETYHQVPNYFGSTQNANNSSIISYIQ